MKVKVFVILKEPYLKLWTSLCDGAMEVWIVDGKWIRENLEIDFTQGGNGEKYHFVPRNEIWIDNGLNEDEILPTLLHELVEQRLMAGGLDYERAHDVSSAIELAYRRIKYPEHPEYKEQHMWARVEDLAAAVVEMDRMGGAK